MSKIKLIIEALDNLKLHDIVVYDMRERSPFFDYFVLSTATNTRQLKAAVDHVKEHLAAKEYPTPAVEGTHSNAWILMDAKDIVVNIFTAEERAFYNIEKMLADVQKIDVSTR